MNAVARLSRHFALATLAAGALACASPVVAAAAPDGDADAAAAARRVETRARTRSEPPDRARNVILFVGDGMSITTITASRILEGQRKGGPGEDNRLSFEEFPHTALVRTYSANQQTADSAPTATAMLTGHRANDGALSVAASVGENEADRAVVAAGALATVLEQAEAQGLATGIVTTTRITHATPAAAYAHTPNRDWEYDAPLARTGGSLADIALQLVEHQKRGDGLEVVLGGGRQMLLPQSASDPEYPAQHGLRRDGRNLVDEWIAAQPASRFVWRKSDFDAVDPAKTRHLLGLFEPSHLRYETDRATDAAGEPSLAEMTRKAIALLERNRKGYFLLVEGGRIDHAHHAGNAFRALTDTIALSDAVRVAVEATAERDTLLLVTADHSHVLTMAGYPARGNPILGLVRTPGARDASRDVDGHPYATLSYANGPGLGVISPGAEARGRLPVNAGRADDLSRLDTTAESFHQQSLVALPGETHGGDDVALFARGPGSRLAGGVIDQIEIYWIMRRALGLTPAP